MGGELRFLAFTVLCIPFAIAIPGQDPLIIDNPPPVNPFIVDSYTARTRGVISPLFSRSMNILGLKLSMDPWLMVRSLKQMRL